jgi:nucleotide-binding universal stress UspA family protein
MFERILLAVDASEHSRKAVAAAAEIASQFRSEVLVVHVREPRLAETGDHLETEREANELAEWAAGELRSPGVRARISVSSGGLRGAAGAILAVAGDFHPGLIIMGSRGPTELEGLLLGSVSHKVIQLADSPVLVVR